MSQAVLNIKDIIGTPNAIIQTLGSRLFETASKSLKQGNVIILDFSGVNNLTSGFCNSSIGKLYTTFPDIAEKNIVIENIDSSSVWYEKIQESIDLAINPDKARSIDDSILALFE